MSQSPHHVWTLAKDGRKARCELIQYSHGLELRLDVDGEMRTTRLCRDRDEWLQVNYEWRKTLEAKGWREPPHPTGT